jgi:NADH:ubiquinone oxidoreductase subunit 6 (subunit J)
MITKMKVCFYLALAFLLAGIVFVCMAFTSLGKIAVIVGLSAVLVALIFVILAFVFALKADNSHYKPEDNPPKAH